MGWASTWNLGEYKSLGPFTTFVKSFLVVLAVVTNPILAYLLTEVKGGIARMLSRLDLTYSS